MSPQSGTQSVSSVTVDSRNTPEIKEIKRDEIFTRFDKPFGIEQETFNLCWLGVAHIFAGYMCLLNVFRMAPWSVIIIELLFGYAGGVGITVGAHRFWTHKTFKANLRLQSLLMIMQTIANQYPIHKWSRDHRIHHKYTDLEADPHNSKRGFWFSHMGWLFLPKRKELRQKLKTFELTDLENDPVVRFQSKWYWTLTAIFCFIVPIYATYFVWRMPLLYCIASNYRRYVASLHFTWFVNSLAHMWGDKPYDKNISSTQNEFVSFVAVGEGWHNYHHTFPWDYKASEFGWKINFSTAFIDFFAAIGWAYDMKIVSHKMLKDRLRRTGDGSHVDTDTAVNTAVVRHNRKCTDYSSSADLAELMKTTDKPVWGWDDETLSDDFRNVTKILRPEKNRND